MSRRRARQRTSASFSFLNSCCHCLSLSLSLSLTLFASASPSWHIHSAYFCHPVSLSHAMTSRRQGEARGKTLCASGRKGVGCLALTLAHTHMFVLQMCSCDPFHLLVSLYSQSSMMTHHSHLMPLAILRATLHAVTCTGNLHDMRREMRGRRTGRDHKIMRALLCRKALGST